MKKRTRILSIIAGIGVVAILLLFAIRSLFLPQGEIKLKYYYDYDRQFPLRVQVDTLNARLWHVSYLSARARRVPALLSLPAIGEPPYPAVIFLHGAGDHKAKDYMMLGDSMFSAAGLAVLRIDIDLHGERAREGFDGDELKNYRHLIRDVLAQTVFDLRRGVDYLDSLPFIDSTRTGFMGISLGGIIGSVFCGVENRVEFPIIALAGGGLRWIFGKDAFSERVGAMLAPIEPLNFIGKISPRPVLFLNASRDEVIPRPTSLLLHRTAGEPKKVIWYDAPHHMPPVPAFRDCVKWFREKMGLPPTAATK